MAILFLFEFLRHIRLVEVKLSYSTTERGVCYELLKLENDAPRL